MKLILLYSLRNLIARRLTTTLTTCGMALVVFVFATVLMLSEGLKQTLVSTGEYNNVVVIRKGSNVDVQSAVEKQKALLIETLPEIAIDEDGNRLFAKEVIVLIVMPKRETKSPANIVIRGIDEKSVRLRPQVRLIEGRLPNFGLNEVIVGKSISERFEGALLGDKLRFAMRDWTVVGIFDAGNRGYNSEIWGDVNQMMQAFKRPVYSSVIFRLKDSKDFDVVKSKIEKDPRISLEAKRETRYYEEQSEMMSKFLKILGLSLTTIFSIGAIIGAMITMYSAVANRQSEIGTLRALGFQKRTVLGAFLFESLLLGVIGGIIGIIMSSFTQYITISTMNWQTFSQLTFSFTLSLEIVIQSMLFAVFMGLIGGMLPAIVASRKNIVSSLRSA
ncbi:MAG: ABC transporter permease [Thermodesulfovibrionales bacterium]|nr:ABC transporter permease [Thermodesulfovibrionales bacterium]